jgi:predicted SnoaL-like aldol condensation-catalyzing enzyme
MILCDRWAKITYLTEYDPAFVNIIGTICLFSVAVRKENIEFAISHLVNSYRKHNNYIKQYKTWILSYTCQTLKR